jgi:hypothetical protein
MVRAALQGGAAMMSGRTLGARGISLLAAAGSLLGGAGPALLPGGVGVSPALGQVEGTATWLWEVSTPDGDAIVEPGETATVRLSIDLSPSPGEQGVQAFGAIIWDTLGGLNADTGGIISWVIDPRLTLHLGDMTTTDGVSLYLSTAAQQGDPCCLTSDPIWIMDFTWGTDDYSPRTVEYTTMTYEGIAAIWFSSGNWKYVEWPAIDTTANFAVVPVPGAAFMLGSICSVFALRRTRSVHAHRKHVMTRDATCAPTCAPVVGLLVCAAVANAQVQILVAFDGINGCETIEFDSVPEDPEIDPADLGSWTKSSDVDDPPFNEEFGDYCDIKVDPEDGTTLWGIGEYMKTFAGQDPHWSTWIFSFTLDCSE